MNYFIIGDIHGCYYTFMKLLLNWNSNEEYLIILGDLIDRGNFSASVVKKCYDLETKCDNCTILKGNHEAELIEFYEHGFNDNWTEQGGSKTLDNFKSNQINKQSIYSWLKKMPLKFETNEFLVTHAGITETENPYEENNSDSVLWNRKKIKNIHKLQIHGHTPLLKKHPEFNEKANSWNIDTGAYYGYGLTGIKLNMFGRVMKILVVDTDSQDIEK